MKISRRNMNKGHLRKAKVLAEGTGSNVGYGWSNFESNGNESVYHASLIMDGIIHRVEFSHDELKHLVRYYHETEAGTRQKGHHSSAEIGRDAALHSLARTLAYVTPMGTKTGRITSDEENINELANSFGQGARRDGQIREEIARLKDRVRKATCGKCDGTGWYKYDDTHSKKCEHCCKHERGGWLLTEAYAGYKPGFDTYACAAGCGTIVKQLKR